MVYYGFIAFALYFVLYLLYHRASSLKTTLCLNEYEQFYTRYQQKRILILFIVPLISIVLTLIINSYSFVWASVAGGVTYFLYTPLMILWHNRFKSKSREFNIE